MSDQKPKQREGDQPLPRRNAHPVIQDLVIADMSDRRALGIQRYGTALQPHNGRDALRDAYEEAIDLTMYLRQCLYERDHPLPAATILTDNSITCPVCHMTSHHPMDVRTGYCGNCHEYTSAGSDGDLRPSHLLGTPPIAEPNNQEE